MGESADSGGGVGGDNVDRSNPAEMAAREKDFRESLGYTGDQGRDDFAADVNRGEFKYTQDLERQAAERQFSSPANQGLSDAAQRQADDERDAARIAAERAESDARLAAVRRQQAAAGQTSVDPLAQLAVDRLAIADSGMITDVDPVMPGPRGSLISDDLMRETLLAQQMIADEKTMFPPDFQEKYGYSNVAPRMPLGATKATSATAANVVQGPPDPESAGGQPSAIVDPAADVFAISPMEQIAIDRRPDPESLAFDDLADFYNPDGSVKTTGRDIDPGPQDEDQYDSRDDVKAYQAAMRQASGGSLLDRVIGGITGGKSEAEIAAINKAYVDRPYSALGISPGLALAATGDKALAGR